jgi:hypothetical protein
MVALDGDGMCADDAAWAMLADTATKALMLPGLSREGVRQMAEVVQSSRRAAGLHPLRLQGGDWPVTEPEMREGDL